MQGKDARNILIKSGLPKNVLSELWRICDIGEKGYLTKGEFIIAIHLIGLYKKNMPLPVQLPDNLISVARRNSMIPPSPASGAAQGPRFGSTSTAGIQRFGSSSNISVPKRFGSNANIGIQPLQVPQPPPQPQLQMVSNVHMIPGYDSNGISQIRNIVGENTQQIFNYQTQIKELYNSVLVEQ